MSKRKATQSMIGLEKALNRLKDALNVNPANSLCIDGTIHRFEVTLELYWETLKIMLAYEGIEVRTPSETLKQAFAVDWIQNDAEWLQMLHDKNEISNVYDEDSAKKIYENIIGYFPEMQDTFNRLQKRYS